jgi:hypothetical protein
MIAVLVVATIGSGPDVAVETAHLERIIGRASWTGPEPVDVCAALGLVPGVPEAAPRVAVLVTSGGERAVTLAGRVSLEHLETADVCALPAAFREARETYAIVGVTLAEGARARVVVAPERLVSP